MTQRCQRTKLLDELRSMRKISTRPYSGSERCPDGNRVRVSSKLYIWKGTLAKKTQHKIEEFGGIFGCHFQVRFWIFCKKTWMKFFSKHLNAGCSVVGRLNLLI